MQPKLHSINALAVELRRDRRSLARELGELPPAKIETQRGRTLRWYFLADVIEHLYLPAPKSLDVDEYDDQRQRLAAAQAEKVEAENAIRRGELADMRTVERHWTDLIANARAKLLAVPSRLAVEVPEDVRAAVQRRARELVYEALTELAGYEPEAADE